MSVQYKTSDGWKNISSSSNNAVDTVENGNMNPVTSNAVYDYPIDSITDGQYRPPTSNAVYDRLKPKVWTSSISIGTSTWDVSISRSVDFVHVRLRCTGTGTATIGTVTYFTGAPDWCKFREAVSQLTTSPETTTLDVASNNSVTYLGGNLNQNSEWNATCLAADADV